MVWEDVMSDKIYKDSWGAKYKRSAFGSVKGKDGHRYDQVSMGPLGNIFGTLFWIAIIVYAIISDPFMAAYILLIILSIVAAIRGLLGIKDKSNAKAPSNLMAAGSILAFFIAFSINYDMGANLYTLYVLSLVLALGFLIASRMRLYAIFGFISLVLDIACSVLYVYGFMENASAFILALLVLILPLLARDEESELRPLHIAALVLIGLLAVKVVIYDGIRFGFYGSLFTSLSLLPRVLRDFFFRFVPVLSLGAFMYLIVKKRKPLWAGVSMAIFAIIEILILTSMFRAYLADPATAVRLSACALATIGIVWQKKRYVAPEPPAEEEESADSKPEALEEQPAEDAAAPQMDADQESTASEDGCTSDKLEP